MPLIKNCCICEILIKPSDTNIICDLCKLPLHTTCTGLSRAEIQCLTMKDRHIIFHCDNCAQKNKEINEIKLMLISLQEEIKQLKEVQTANKIQPSAEYTEEVIGEIADRNRRARNIIMFNIKEVNATAIEDRRAEDENYVKNVISKISDISTTDIRVSRIGKKIEGKDRPIKITFKHEEDALLILKIEKTYRGIFK